MAVLLFVNLKGGVAKTTNVVAVAEGLADLGKRVLVIDADHQCAASELLLGEGRATQAEKRQRTLHDLLAAMLDPEFESKQIAGYVATEASDVAPLRERMAVLPCSVRIDDFQTNMAKGRKGFPTTKEFLATWRKRRSQLRKWLAASYDYTLIDCPPSLPVQVQFLLRIADAYVVPCVPDRLSLRGALWLQERLGRLPSAAPPALGLLWTLYREQNEHHRHTVSLVQKQIPRLASLPRPFETVIPNSVDIVRALQPEDGMWRNDRHRSFTHKYTAKFSRLYDGLAREVVRRAERLPIEASRRPRTGAERPSVAGQ